MVFIGWIWIAAFDEYRGLGNRPQFVDLASVFPPRPDHGRWATAKESVQIDCHNGIQELNDWEQRFITGRVRSTNYVARIPNSDRLLVLEYEGDITCGAMSQLPLTGVLEELRSRRRSWLQGEGLVLPETGTILKLCLSCTPESEKRLLLYCAFLPLLSIFLIARYGKKYRQQIEWRRP